MYNSNNLKQNKIFYSIFSVSLVYFLLFSAFYLVCFIDKDGLYKLIMSERSFENLPFALTNDNLKLISEELMKYISGRLQFLETKVTIDGVLTDFYSVRSKIHMADVRNLIVTFLKIYYISIMCLIISFFKIIRYDKFLQILKVIYKRVVVIISIVLTAIFAFAAINFETFFIRFHEVLFTNDLWLLDPSEDYIICLLPEKIFMIYGFRIIISMIISILFSLFVLQILSKIQSRQEAR